MQALPNSCLPAGLMLLMLAVLPRLSAQDSLSAPSIVSYQVDKMDLQFYQAAIAYQNLDMDKAAKHIRQGAAPLGWAELQMQGEDAQRVQSLRKKIGALARELSESKLSEPQVMTYFFIQAHREMAYFQWQQSKASFSQKHLRNSGTALERSLLHSAHALRLLGSLGEWEISPEPNSFNLSPDTYLGAQKMAPAMVMGVSFESREIEAAISYARSLVKKIDQGLSSWPVKR